MEEKHLHLSDSVTSCLSYDVIQQLISLVNNMMFPLRRLQPPDAAVNHSDIITLLPMRLQQ